MELSKVVHEVEGEIKSCGNRNPIEDCVAISCASVRCQETIVSRVLWCGIIVVILQLRRVAKGSCPFHGIHARVDAQTRDTSRTGQIPSQAFAEYAPILGSSALLVKY